MFERKFRSIEEVTYSIKSFLKWDITSSTSIQKSCVRGEKFAQIQKNRTKRAVFERKFRSIEEVTCSIKSFLKWAITFSSTIQKVMWEVKNLPRKLTSISKILFLCWGKNSISSKPNRTSNSSWHDTWFLYFFIYKPDERIGWKMKNYISTNDNVSYPWLILKQPRGVRSAYPRCGLNFSFCRCSSITCACVFFPLI